MGAFAGSGDVNGTMKIVDTPAQAWLRENGLRQTRGRVAIIEELRRAQSPLTLSELHGRIKSQRCDFATVFRFIQILEKKRIVQRHTWNDRQIHYELCGRHDGHHYHHLICTKCHHVEEIEACTVAALEKELVRQKGYKDVSHSLEFFGICPDCQHQDGRSGYVQGKPLRS
jgi:Fur family transcriptional regulator, ferric uptake regulator